MKKLKLIKFVFSFSIFLGSFLFYTHSAHAATYYIDYSGGSDSNSGLSKSTPWKHQPYMKGFAGTYTHQAGDIFIFKGGVTWAWSVADPIFPWNIQTGGSTGNPDQYTVDKTWYAGSSWTPPIFDGCQTAEGLNVCGLNGAATLGANSWLLGDGGNTVSNIVINGLRFQNIGNPSSTQYATGTAVDFSGSGSSIEVENCILTPHSVQAFSYSNYYNRQNAGSIYIHDNQISYAGRGVIYGYTGYTVNDVRVYNNKWEGPGLTLAGDLYSTGGFHNDGLMVGCPAGCSGTAPSVTNILFHNNLFNGSWEYCTAQYYSNGYTSNTSIYNNVFSIENNSSNGTPMQNFVEFGSNDWGKINVYNNTFSSDALVGYDTGVNKGFCIAYATNTVNPLTTNVENNIFSGVAIGSLIASRTGNNVTIDHNLYNITTLGGYGELDYIGSNQYKSLSSTCAAGYDCNSLGGNNYSSSYPGFISLPNGNVGSGNWNLLNTSPAIKAGTNLSSTFTTDLNNNPRPTTGAWDIGAYEFTPASTPAPTPTSVPVYRFWSDKYNHHFYTASLDEKNYVISHYPDAVWHYEGIGFNAYSTQESGTVPVYRFWSSKYNGHFYTASQSEKDYVSSHYPSNVWNYEGITFYAYPAQEANTTPVYRFWSNQYNGHFYTSSQSEKDYILSHYPSNVWSYEGIAWWVPNN